MLLIFVFSIFELFIILEIEKKKNGVIFNKFMMYRISLQYMILTQRKELDFEHSDY
jgi:hypothetical protein